MERTDTAVVWSTLTQWRSQGLPGWAARPPGEPK